LGPLNEGEGKITYFTFANFLGLLRILAGPYVAWLLWQGQFDLAFFIFLFAGLTDAVDGPIARKTGTANEFGLFLDPIADKLFINTLYIAMWYFDHLPAWVVILVFLRDFFIAFTIILSKLLKTNLLVKPMWLSKINTGVQIGLIAFVLGQLAFGLPLGLAIAVTTWIMAGTTIGSWILYFLRMIGRYPKTED